MSLVLRCCVVVLVGIASMAPVYPHESVAASKTITETLSLTFLTASLGWRATDRWNPDTGARGPLTVSRTTDGGITWHAVTTIPGVGHDTSGSYNVSAAEILFASPHDGWLFGNLLFATHDGGRTWRQIPLRGAQTRLSVSRGSVWRIDSSCGGTTNYCRFWLLASTAHSDAWQVMRPQPPAGPIIGWNLARANPLHAWLAGGLHMVRNHRVLRLLDTRDGGRSWQALPMPCSRNADESMFAQVVPYTATDLWLFCASQPSAGSQPKSVFRSSNGGRTWKMVAGSGLHRPHNLSISGYFESAAVTTQSDAWIALARGTLLHTAYGGHTWRPSIPPTVVNPLDGGVGPVQFVDARHGWLFSFPNLLFRTTDGGRHWQRITLG